MGFVRTLKLGACVSLGLAAAACGGGGGGGGGTTTTPPPTTTNNTASVIIDSGPMQQSVNTLFTSVTICVPGSTTSCQTIDHIQVDTGSYGLRILAPILNLTLPVETLANGSSLAECTQFVDGFSWGPVVTADIQIAGETAHSVPVQAIGDTRFTNIPAGCSGTGGTEEDTVSSFGANGIIGVGPFELDCGDCDTVSANGFYYACTAASCTDTTVPANLQIPNPVTHFAADNNGVIIVLPSVASAGASNVTGSLIFGIDTQSDNASGTQTVLTVDDDAELIVQFNGTPFDNSFIDSGSNGIYFTDTSITTCSAPPSDPTSQIVNFYCPSSTLTLPITLQGQNGTQTNNLTFMVGNAINMLENTDFDAYPQLAGIIPPESDVGFDYGLPFFYGKRVAVAVQGAMTTAGTGPYFAF